MGKSRLNASLASRLSMTGGLRSSAMSAGSSINKRLSLDDARLKLNTKNTSLKTIKSSSSIRDARELLQKNQKQKEIIKTIINNDATVSRSSRAILTTKKQTTSGEPLMIVTGLANVRKEGDRLKIVRKPEHKVISDGRNTVVVLKNNTASGVAKSTRHIDDHDEVDETRFDPTNVAPIKIRIDNDHRLSSSVRVAKSREPQEPLFVNKSTKRYSSAAHNDYESMDYDDYEQDRTVTARLGPSQSTVRSSSNSQHDNGYRLVVSNLHAKVTEDDILELFSDVGPIKRARFLDKGIAEVVYVKVEHAREAIDKYDRNELDGREMRIELVNEPGSLGSAAYASVAPSRQPVKYTSNSSKILDHITSSSPSQSSTSIFKFNTPQAPPSTTTTFNLNHNIHSAGELLTQPKNGLNGPKNWLSDKFKTIDNDFIDHVHLPESKARPSTGRISVDQSIIQHVLFNKNQVVNKAPVTFTVKL